MLLALAVAPAATAAVTEESSATLDPFGKVDLYREAAQPTRVVLFLSDTDGWNRPDVESARALASLDALVVGIDVPRYLATVGARGGDELYPFADLEVLSQFVQKKVKLPTYVPPIVMGDGVGATLAYAVAAAARPNGFAAAVSLGFCPDIALPKPLGAGSGLRLARGSSAGSYRLEPASTLAVPWTILQPAAGDGCDPGIARRFASAAPGTELMTLATRERLDDPEDWLPHLRHVLERVSGGTRTASPATGAGDVGDLPLVEVPARGAPRALAVIFSGDGGWASLDREVGDALAAAGIGVVGMNSLSYFWSKRTPDGAAVDLARIIRSYRERWQTPRVLLIGYSRGADVLPFLASRLPGDLRPAVALVALLGPARTTDFEFHLTDWLGGDDPSAQPVGPEVAQLADLRVLCVQGADEDESLCPTLDPTRTIRMVLAGGHHFGGDYGVIARRILAEAQLAPEPSPSPGGPSAGVSSTRSGAP
jgi:type IV secretory pathway VirJ component